MAKLEGRIIEIHQCPVCGSTERYCESLAKQEKGRGHMRREINYCFRLTQKLCLDEEVAKTLPTGTAVPAYMVAEDICMGFPDKPCGLIYATKIEETAVKKQPDLLRPGQGGFQMPPGGFPRRN